MAEIVNVAAAVGLTLPKDTIDNTIDLTVRFYQRPKEKTEVSPSEEARYRFKPSMLLDLEAERPMEVLRRPSDPAHLIPIT